MKLNKIIVLGSGALKIGEAGEFDYSGSQCLKALREEGIKTVLVNPNIATIQTSQNLADKIYFLPVNPYFVTKIIEKEKPDGILLSFGGQTALNCGLALDQLGVLKKHQVKVLGTSVKTIEVTEDRELFAKTLAQIGVLVPKGGFAKTVNQALKIAQKLNYPLMVRTGFSLGGLGSAVVKNEQELISLATVSLKNAPQITVEEYLKHWKEIEYEVVRDQSGNKITVCNMENLDPLGVHTGESIVVAPSQTLNNREYHYLRELALKVIEHLKIVGECNIQFALDPRSEQYRVIEVNARLSRSSALASKATGYPLAYIGAKLSLGKLLPDLKNSVTLKTSAFFEPALDYIVVKVPRWDLQKFIGVKDTIGSAMKSVGEVMAIGRSFPEALQKAIRMLEIGQDGLLIGNGNGQPHKTSLEEHLTPSTKRLYTLAEELANGTSVEEIYKASGVDPWFLYQIKQIVDLGQKLRTGKIRLNYPNLLQAKQFGFSDKLIAKGAKKTEQEIRALRKKLKIIPKVLHIDTLAAEYPAKTNYLYLSYNASESEDQLTNDQRQYTNPRDLKTKKAIVIGGGPYRIGSSVEFDWGAVTCAQTLRQKGLETIIINCNPETVSTDFDSADKLYFEELTFERVLDIYELEKNASLVLAFGGQVSNNLALPLYQNGCTILGTSPVSIDRAEDRNQFSALLDTLKIEQPKWRALQTLSDALSFAKKIKYPVLVRPSYVLSGQAMNVANSPTELKKYLKDATDLSSDHPVVISKFVDNAKEIEIDGVGKSGELLIYAISEHIENAGVHSGDATIVLPSQRMYLETMRQIKVATKDIVKALNINGPFNIQFLAKDNKVLVIELNLRASRSFPFVSKVLGHNFVEMATKVMLGEDLKGDYKTIHLDYVAVKAPQFSFNRIKGADPTLRVEMSSTGEVACFGEDLSEAYLKSLIAAGFKMPKKNIFLSLGGDKNKLDFLKSAKRLKELGFKIFSTDHTSEFLKKNGVENTRVYKVSEKKPPSAIDLVTEGKIDMAINITDLSVPRAAKDGFYIRRACIDFGVSLITNLQSAVNLTNALSTQKLDDLKIKSWDEYIVMGD